jgi:hypothetical protein
VDGSEVSYSGYPCAKDEDDSLPVYIEEELYLRDR